MNALGEHEELVKVLSELHSVSVCACCLEYYREQYCRDVD